MKIEAIKNNITKLSVTQKRELIDFIKNSYSVFNNYSKVESCPHCGFTHIVKNGTRNGISRYICRDCKKSFTFKTNTVLQGIQKLNKWNDFVEDFMTLNISTIKEIKHKLGISTQTAIDWRHKLLSALVNKENIFKKETIEFDEAWFLISRKGRKNMGINDKKVYKKWRKNQVGDTDYVVKLFVSYGRDNNLLDMNVSHMGRTSVKDMENYFLTSKFQDIKVYTDKHPTYSAYFRKKNISHETFMSKLHIQPENNEVHNQTVNAYIRDFKYFVNKHMKGVSTKYLGFYAKWFEFIINTKKDIQKTISESKPVRFNIAENICGIVVMDYNGLECYRQSEKSFIRFLEFNGRTNYGFCKNHYYNCA